MTVYGERRTKKHGRVWKEEFAHTRHENYRDLPLTSLDINTPGLRRPNCKTDIEVCVCIMCM